jgi:hypothetical protein
VEESPWAGFVENLDLDGFTGKIPLDD